MSAFHRIVADSPAVVLRWRLEPGWPVEKVTENIRRFGYTAADLLSGAVPLQSLFHPPGDGHAQPINLNASERGVYQSLEYNLQTADRGLRPVRLVARAIDDGAGGVACEGLLRELAEGLEHEDRLRLLEQAVNTTHNGIVIADARRPDFPIIFANRAVGTISGYSPEEFLGHNCRFLQRGDAQQPALETVRRALRDRTSCEAVLRNYRKDGTLFWNEVRISPVTNHRGEVTHFIGVQADITARKEAEASLARRDAILEAINIATETLLRSPDYEKALPAALAQIGGVTNADHLCIWREKNSARGPTLNLVRCWSNARVPAPDSASLQALPWDPSNGWPSAGLLRAGKPLQGGLASCSPVERALLENLGVGSFLCLPIFDGPDHFWGVLSVGSVAAGLSWPQVEVDALLSATRVLGAVIQSQDTARALRHSEERFRELSEVSPIGVFEADLRGRITYANRRLGEMFALAPEDFTRGAWRAYFQRTDLVTIARAWRDAIIHGEGFHGDFKIRQHKGNDRWLKTSLTPLRDPDSHITGYVGCIDDVTAYHLASEALRESERKYRSLVTNLKEVVFQTDAQGNWTFLNHAWTEVTGFPLRETLGRCFLDYVHPDDRERNNRLFAPLIERRKEYCRHEVRYLTRTGGFRWIEVFARLTVDEAGAITGTAGTLADVTERRNAEDARRRQLAAIEAAIDGVAILDPDGVYTYLNSTHLTLFGFNSPAELIGKTWRELYTPEETAHIDKHAFPVLMQNGRWRGIVKARRRDGSLFDEELSLTLIEGGGLVCVCRDITERKRNEEQVERSLREKEVMLKEIHHRVKNNMQIVSSLLSLQLEHVRGEETRHMFIDSQNRIDSMALVHEKLYQSRDLGRIDFADYVRDLTDNLVVSQGARSRGIVFRLHADDVFLGIDAAIPCGLIINELVTNAYKHAFMPGTAGHIDLHLAREPDGALLLEVADDGCGIPADIDLARTRSLGMQLVHTLVQQLRGTIEVHRSRGTRFVLRLQEPAPKHPLA